MHPPSVDTLARSLADLGLPHPLAVDAAREAIARGDPTAARALAKDARRRLLTPVVNATGVLLHTNLGRAPLGSARTRASEGWRAANLELDLGTGRRGSRQSHLSPLLTRLTGAEDALVVNNGAAAVLVALAALAAGRDVVVSRGELVEIGGGFRIPEVLAASGARLVEVGTTNRTRLGDYRAAVDHHDVGAILKVHQSNFRQVGFTEQVDVAALVTLGPPVVADIGSGLLDANAPWLEGPPPAWLAGEPAARQTLAAGAALVTFSGDKLLGGPQAGVVAGSSEAVSACARLPLVRALRPGGLVLETLQATLLAYLSRQGRAIPFWRMATEPVAALEARAAALGVGEVVHCRSAAGGGSLPGLEIASAGVAVPGDRLRALREWDPPVLGLARDGATLLDLRSVDPADDEVLAAALAAASAP